MVNRKINRQSGAALLAILLLLSFFVTIVVLAHEVGFEISGRYRNTYQEDYAWARANAEFINALEFLVVPEEGNDQGTTVVTDDFEIVSYDSRIPINQFATSPIGRILLARYFQERMQVSDVRSIDLVNALRDWIDADDVAGDNEGSEAAFYDNLQLPLNRKLRGIGELSIVPGFRRAPLSVLENEVRFFGSSKLALEGIDPGVAAILFQLEPREAERLRSRVDQMVTAGNKNTTLEAMAATGIGIDVTDLGSLLQVESRMYSVVGIGKQAGSETRVNGIFKKSGNNLSLLSLQTRSSTIN